MKRKDRRKADRLVPGAICGAVIGGLIRIVLGGIICERTVPGG